MIDQNSTLKSVEIIALSRLVIFCAAVTLVSGCVTTPVYDESWAPQAQAERGVCPDIDGVYQNSGESFERKNGELKKKELSLAHLMNGGWELETHHAPDRLGTTYYRAPNDDYRTVGLVRNGDKLQVEAALADGTTRKFALPLRHGCRDSLMVLETAWGYDLFAAAYFHGYYAIGRADDGSLLGYQSATGEVLAVFWNSSASWTRFPQALPLQEARQSDARLSDSDR